MRQKLLIFAPMLAAFLVCAVTLQSCYLTGTYEIDIPIDAIFRLDSILKKDSVIILESDPRDSSNYSMITLRDVDLERSSLTVTKKSVTKTKMYDLEKAGFTPRVTVPHNGAVYTMWARSNLDKSHGSRK